jgi:hypothetical protein
VRFRLILQAFPRAFFLRFALKAQNSAFVVRLSAVEGTSNNGRASSRPQFMSLNDPLRTSGQSWDVQNSVRVKMS